MSKRIFVKVKTNSKNPRVEKLDETHFAVSVNEPPKEGKANYAVVKALADYLGIAQSRIMIVSGAASKEKIIEIV